MNEPCLRFRFPQKYNLRQELQVMSTEGKDKGTGREGTSAYACIIEVTEGQQTLEMCTVCGPGLSLAEMVF